MAFAVIWIYAMRQLLYMTPEPFNCQRLAVVAICHQRLRCTLWILMPRPYEGLKRHK